MWPWLPPRTGARLDGNLAVQRKFQALATPVIGDGAPQLSDLVSQLDTLADVRELCALAAGA